MEFKKGSTYKRDDIHMLYYGKPVPKKGTGSWTTGYARVDDELIVFMNINIPGRTGHNFPNRYDKTNKTIVWYGKPKTHSEQPIFKKLIHGKIKPHFFARWNTKDPFTYLGIGNVVSHSDGHTTFTSKGKPAKNIEVILTCQDAEEILSITKGEKNLQTTFALEKYLEEFIIDNWNSLEIFKNYDRNEDEVDGKRKKYRTDTGEIDIFAISKDKKEYLVIELKKGRASEKVVGQIQTYMGFIKEEIAKKNQKVKGLIIALEDDLKIKRALSINPDIEFYRYEVKFDLIKS